MKDTAYGNTHFWVSCRYFEAGQWDDAQSHLTKAISYRPNLVNQPEEFIQHLTEETLTTRRMSAPQQFVENVFSNLPDSAKSLEAYRPMLLGKVLVGQALQKYAQDA